MARKYDNRKRINALEKRVDRLEVFCGGLYLSLLLLIVALIVVSFI